jgi:hypothetical protein
LEDSGLLVRRARRFARKYGVLFGVPKSTGLLRAIFDARATNNAMVPPPRLHLPSVSEILTVAFQSTWAVDIDLRHWFFQFPIAEAIQPYFCVRSGRGVFSMARMCMGWSFSMYIAQSTAAQLADDGTGGTATFVDGFLVGGRSSADSRARADSLLSRLQAVGATVNWGKTDMEPAQTKIFAGLQLDLAAKKWRLDPSWTVKAVALLKSSMDRTSLPLRQWFQCAGTVLWSLRATLQPLASVFCLLQWMRSATTGMEPSKQMWDRRVPISDGAREVFQTAVVLIGKNGYHEWLKTEGVVRIVTDASLQGWANVYNGVVHYGCFPVPYSHSYLAEMDGAYRAIERLVQLEHVHSSLIELETDNTAVFFGLLAGHSRSRLANEMIGNMLQMMRQARCRLDLAWRPSGVNAADPWTRLGADE